MPAKKAQPRADKRIGVVGLGIMGQGIVTCLLACGFEVVGCDQNARRRTAALRHVAEAMTELGRRGIVQKRALPGWRRRVRVAPSAAELADCTFVIEAVTEYLALKRRVYADLERVLSPEAVIASNTSSLPITVLQKGRTHPERFIGMHWGEPAQIMRYLEIIPGRETSATTVDRTRTVGDRCGKEPTVLKEDIQGFLSNRMMYAMIREAFHLVEAGVADLETVDRSFRNDMGWWALLAGPFRWMDLTGIPSYELVMKGLLPKLCNDRKVPRLMREVVASGATGVGNAKGFYPYTKDSARAWEKAWIDFTYDTRKLADKYAARLG